jgi:hypothetical protein
MPLEIFARRVVGPSGTTAGEVAAVRATATASAVAPAVSNGAAPDWPTASTTGPTGTLTNDANDYFNSAGATYTSRNFTSTGTIQVVANDVTFTNCRFAGHLLVNEKSGITFTDCEFEGGVGVSSSADILFLRAKMETFGDGDAFHITNDGTSHDNEDITLRDCYVYDVNAAVGSHSDGIQVRGSLRLWVDHCYIDLGPPEFEHNAALYLENGPNGSNDDWIIEDSYFASGYGATLYISGAGGPGIFRNNTIIPAAPSVGGDTESTDLSTRPRTSYMNAPAPGDVTASGNVDENGDPYDVHNP